MSALFAATHPQRTSSLVLMGAFAREMEAPDYPYGVRRDELRRRLALLDEDDWASAAVRDWIGRVGPDVVGDPEAMRWYTSYMRRGASPGAVRALRLMNAEIDIRHVLPTINVPTLVLYRAEESWRDGSRFLGEHIPAAATVVLPGADHLPWEGDRDALLDEIERFLSAIRKDAEPDRVLATLVATGVVGSAGKATEVLPKHDRLVRAQLARFRGQEIGIEGGEVMAMFDGPARAVRCAAAIADGLGTLGLDVRTGVHTGEVEQANGSVQGIAVDVTSRIAAAAQPGEVIVSSTVKDIVAGSGIAFEERGEHELEGVPGTWRLYAARP
jgi:class 3 adenylate cyclase